MQADTELISYSEENVTSPNGFCNLHPNFRICKTVLILGRLTYSEGQSLYPDVLWSRANAFYCFINIQGLTGKHQCWGHHGHGA